jgi:hypothetical protein
MLLWGFVANIFRNMTVFVHQSNIFRIFADGIAYPVGRHTGYWISQGRFPMAGEVCLVRLFSYKFIAMDFTRLT